MFPGPSPIAREDPMANRTVGVCLKRDDALATQVLRELSKWLAEQGIEALLDEEAAQALGREALSHRELARRSELLVVLGGDGTILRVVREIGDCVVPILGVNLGRLGFLAEIRPAEQFDAIERALRGEMPIEQRIRLDVRVEREGRVIAQRCALNEIVVGSSLSRLVDLETLADGKPVTSYRADGLIVSTPTGSTAYSLSAAGPILLPSVRALLLNPICPHTLSQRPVVLPETMLIEIRVTPSPAGEVRLTVDGQEGVELESGDRVFVERAERPLPLVVSPDHDRFEILRSKLGWGVE
jgi:NAD+ kinase